MNKRKLLLTLLAMVFVLTAATASFAVFPKPDFYPTGFGYLGYTLNQGWFNNSQAWYINLDGSTNNINFARRNAPFYWLSPKLASALPTEPAEPGEVFAAKPMYIVLNSSKTQGPVFSTAPTQPDYSGLWQIYYITWKKGATTRAITSSDPESADNPFGIPENGTPDSKITIEKTNIVIQYPVVAIGPLGGPWYPPAINANTLIYRMRQIQVGPDYARTKIVYLPTFTVFCSDCETNRVGKFIVTIPDVSDATLAAKLGANLAPGLLNMPNSDTQAFYNILNSPQLCQLPIIEACPKYRGELQRCKDFSPIVRLTDLNRVNLPISTVINNPAYVKYLEGKGQLTLANDNIRMGVLFFNNFSQNMIVLN